MCLLVAKLVTMWNELCHQHMLLWQFHLQGLDKLWLQFISQLCKSSVADFCPSGWLPGRGAGRAVFSAISWQLLLVDLFLITGSNGKDREACPSWLYGQEIQVQDYGGERGGDAGCFVVAPFVPCHVECFASFRTPLSSGSISMLLRSGA